MQLSSGQHQPHQETNIGVLDSTSLMLELYKVNESLYLVWTIDILEENSNYVQILNIWDVLPLSEVSKMVRDVDISYWNYCVDILRSCNIRSSEGYNSTTNCMICFTLLKMVENSFQVP